MNAFAQNIFALRQFEFADLKYLSFIFMLPALVFLYWYSFHMKKRALKKFASSNVLEFIVSSVSFQRQIAKAALLLFAMFLIIISLMRPRGNPTEEQIQQEGRDVCFLLDVSNSMLADDLKPSRLERAKLSINDVIDIMSGDRVGLIIFAGSAALKSPLTSDYYFFKNVLNKVSTSDVGQGGTNIGDAIRQAIEKVFAGDEAKYRDIILITDGEDLEDSFPIEAAQYAAQEGIRIHTVGLGDPEGTEVPDPKNPGRIMQYDGKPVMSRLDEKMLQQIAAATPNGTYIPVRTGTMDLGALYRKVIATGEKQQYQSEVKIRWTEWFQVPLLAAIMLLITEWFISERKSERNKKDINRIAFLIPIFICAAIFSSNSNAYAADDAARHVREGNSLYQKGEYGKSMEQYKQAEQLLPESPEIQFNMANSYYQQSQYDKAIELYGKTLTNVKNSAELERKSLYNLGNCSFRQAEKLLDADLNEALNKYKESIEHYRETIERSGDDNQKEYPEVEDAKHNIEVARLRIKDVLDKIKQQQEQQQQEQQQQQNLQEKIKEAIEKQKELEEKTSQTQEEKKKEPEKDISQQAEQLKQDQDENKKGTDDISKQMQDMQQNLSKSGKSSPEQQDKLAKAQQEVDKSSDEQQESSENLEKKDLNKAKENQTNARESLEKALKELQTENKNPSNQNPQQQQQKEGKQDDKKQEEKEQKNAKDKQKTPDKSGKMNPEEAKEKMEQMKARFKRARKLREEDLKEKGYRIIEDTERDRVEKDW